MDFENTNMCKYTRSLYEHTLARDVPSYFSVARIDNLYECTAKPIYAYTDPRPMYAVPSVQNPSSEKHYAHATTTFTNSEVQKESAVAVKSISAVHVIRSPNSSAHSGTYYKDVQDTVYVCSAPSHHISNPIYSAYTHHTPRIFPHSQ
jgi:hypothetical protein